MLCCESSAQGVSPAALFKAGLRLETHGGGDGWQEDGQTDCPETLCPPGKVLHHLQPQQQLLLWNQLCRAVSGTKTSNVMLGFWMKTATTPATFYLHISSCFALSQQKPACYLSAATELVSLHSGLCLLTASVSGADQRKHLQHRAWAAHKALAGG